MKPIRLGTFPKHAPRAERALGNAERSGRARALNTAGAVGLAGAVAGVCAALWVKRPRLFNDPSFTPRHGTPVLFVHGFTSRTSAFYRPARYLRSHGYWVWGFDYGRMRLPFLYGTGDLEQMVGELRANVDKVLAKTGAQQVDIVAHSQGGNLTKLYIAGVGLKPGQPAGHEKVRRVVTMGSPFHGVDLGGGLERVEGYVDKRYGLLAWLFGESALQQLAGSRWSVEHVVPDTHPEVMYTSLYSRRDTVVTPQSTSILEAVDGADVVNLEIPGAPLHPLMPRDEEIARLTRWGLERQPGETEPPEWVREGEGTAFAL